MLVQRHIFSKEQLETYSSGQKGQTWVEVAKESDYDKHGSLLIRGAVQTSKKIVIKRKILCSHLQDQKWPAKHKNVSRSHLPH